MTPALSDNVRAAYPLGWSFTPLDGKKPILKNWTTLPRATLEETLEWIAQGHNIGLRTGQASGVIVIDVDIGGNHAPLDLPPTVAVYTGGGGMHLYYTCSLPLSNSAGKLGLHIDVKADGGQVVFPGSVHPTGAVYEWIHRYELGQIEIAALPDVIYARLTAPEPRPVLRPRPRASGYANVALKLELDAVARAPEGSRNATLNQAAFSMGTLIGGGSLDRATVEAALLAETSLPSGEARKTITSGIEAGIKQPRSVPGKSATGRTPAKAGKTAKKAVVPAEATPEAVPVLPMLNTVVRESIHWLWPGRIAIGKLTLIAGDPGVGKSFITLDIAARVSCECLWPDGAVNIGGGIVLLSAEDDLADTICPRLDAAGADTSQIAALQAVDEDDKLRPFNLADHLPVLELAIQQVPMCRLVIIDPISAYLGHTDSHRNAEVRALLMPLSELAARYQVAVIAVTHLRKGDGKAIYRAMGSLAFAAAARAMFGVTADPDDETKKRRLFFPVKNNIGNDTDGLAFQLEVESHSPPESMPIVKWETGPVATPADEAMGATAKTTDYGAAVSDAAEWLQATLSDGAQPAKEVIKQAKADGISKSSLERAKRKIGVRSSKEGYAGVWLWELKQGDK